MAAAGPPVRASSASPVIRAAASAGASNPLGAGSSSAIERMSPGHPCRVLRGLPPVVQHGPPGQGADQGAVTADEGSGVRQHDRRAATTHADDLVVDPDPVELDGGHAHLASLRPPSGA